jgi:predicted NBD/HSP70 family sugar kinase
MITGSATASLIRRVNRSAILDLVRENSPISRSEIARRLYMSVPTVMRVIEKLEAEDLVRWSGDSQSTGGRPGNLLEFNTDGYSVVGLDLGGSKLFGTVADLGGNIQSEIYRPWISDDPAETLEQVLDLISELLAQPRPPHQHIRGIGVGAPGVTLSRSGVITWAPSLGWRDLPLKDILVERFNFPVVVENDVNLAALGEYGFGAARHAESAVCIAVGTGIGAGVIIDRKIYRGFNQSAGEVGYLPPGISYLGRTYAGFGALESIASGRGVEQRARQFLLQHSLPLPEQGPSSEEVFCAARRGEPWAMQIVSETVDYLALAVGNLSVVLDPQVIVLGGGLARSADLLIEPILARLEGVIPVRPTLVPSNLGYRAAVLGAIMLVLDTTTDYVTIKGIA